MVTITSGQPTDSANLDPHIFSFKPKLNEKSSQIAENLLSDFYERQLKHVQRLQALVNQGNHSERRMSHFSSVFFSNRKKKQRSIIDNGTVTSNHRLSYNLFHKYVQSQKQRQLTLKHLKKLHQTIDQQRHGRRTKVNQRVEERRKTTRTSD